MAMLIKVILEMLAQGFHLHFQLIDLVFEFSENIILFYDFEFKFYEIVDDKFWKFVQLYFYHK